MVWGRNLEMTQDEVIARLKKLLIERLRMSPERVQVLELDSPLLKDGLGMDSLDCIELLMGIEEEFGLFIEESEEEDWMHHFSCLRTISQIVLSTKGELT
jgi:acyl carrier protein